MGWLPGQEPGAPLSYAELGREADKKLDRRAGHQPECGHVPAQTALERHGSPAAAGPARPRTTTTTASAMAIRRAMTKQNMESSTDASGKRWLTASGPWSGWRR